MNSVVVPDHLGFTADHDFARKEARRFLADRCPMSAIRKDPASPDGLDRALWGEIARLGWLGLTAPADLGGVGLDHLHLALLFEEMGRCLLPLPYLGSVLAIEAIRRAGSAAQQDRWVKPIVAGEAVATIALAEPGGAWDPAEIKLSAARGADGWVLRGEKAHVSFGASADLVIVPAKDPDGAIALFAIGIPDGGVKVEDEVVVDTTRRSARMILEGAAIPAAARLEGDGRAALSATLCLGYAMIAAEMVGAAEAVLQKTRDYAVERRQFDRPIGAFQAVKFPIVDMMIGVEQARSLALAAAAAIDHAPESAEAAARMAKAMASSVLARAVKKGVQLHGGYGFTWDCDVHFYFKRALWARATLGDAGYHRRHLAHAILG